ncbi:tail assembly chaperone [Xenorhabdus beddingii]|uniref:Tail assembly chaperone n=1 Tax=Xenorhabdus beddingii TaxID=40578 RepID=A0A1Y2SPM3_9GAMM|nr:tail fiber assembly protein [Xenorhabdus beddingii]OTA20167.1 tail assembly chaperone [Xenorhabdus beddingii]
MVRFDSFSTYKPHNAIEGVAYLVSSDKQDWYECQKLFASDTLKICFDENWVIRAFSYDVSALFPIGLSIAEIEREEVPDGFGWEQDWIYLNGKISLKIPSSEELRQQAESRKRQLLRAANEKIDICQDAVNLELATEAERSVLTQWRHYRVLLNRVDCSDAPDVDWPEQPE